MRGGGFVVKFEIIDPKGKITKIICIICVYVIIATYYNYLIHENIFFISSNKTTFLNILWDETILKGELV